MSPPTLPTALAPTAFAPQHPNYEPGALIDHLAPHTGLPETWSEFGFNLGNDFADTSGSKTDQIPAVSRSWDDTSGEFQNAREHIPNLTTMENPAPGGTHTAQNEKTGKIPNWCQTAEISSQNTQAPFMSDFGRDSPTDLQISTSHSRSYITAKGKSKLMSDPNESSSKKRKSVFPVPNSINHNQLAINSHILPGHMSSFCLTDHPMVSLSPENSQLKEKHGIAKNIELGNHPSPITNQPPEGVSSCIDEEGSITFHLGAFSI
jgi:hypothetical protein